MPWSLRRALRGDPLIHHRRWRRETLGQTVGLQERLRLRTALLCRQSPVTTIRVPELRHPIGLRIDSSDQYVYEQIFTERQYEIDVPTPRTILDAGANVGLATVWFANRFPASKILAIEPDEENFRLLQENTRSYPRVHCIQAGVWHRPAKLMRIIDGAKPWAYRFEETRQAPGVDAIGLDQAAEMLGGQIDLAKIDIEGAERDVFRHPGGWLEGVSTVLVECHDRTVPGCRQAVEEALPIERFERDWCGENLVYRRRNTTMPSHECRT